jgi:hypothetical protein
MNTSFERTDSKDEWLTPPYILKALGEFELDPCSPIIRPFDTAKRHLTKIDDGLSCAWEGRVFCNPPYGSQTKLWMKKLKEHNNGIALIFARTETTTWHEHIWYDADAVFFFRGRIKFYSPDGKESSSAGAPSALVAYGAANAALLRNSGLQGKFVQLK